MVWEHWFVYFVFCASIVDFSSSEIVSKSKHRSITTSHVNLRDTTASERARASENGQQESDFGGFAESGRNHTIANTQDAALFGNNLQTSRCTGMASATETGTSIPTLETAQTLPAQQCGLGDSSDDESDARPPPRSPAALSPGIERRGRDMQRSPASLRSVAPAGLSPRSAAAWAAGLSPRARLPEGLWAEDPAGGAFQLDDSTLSGSSDSSST